MHGFWKIRLTSGVGTNLQRYLLVLYTNFNC